MMMHTTLAQLRTLKLDGLATGLEEQLAQPGMAAMSFEERVALLVDREVHCRNDRKLLRLLKNAHLKYAQAAIEDVDSRSGRGIERREVMSLALGDWVSAGHSVLITGPTGLEHSYGWEVPAAQRLRFLLDFAYATGFRASELVGATLGGIQTDAHGDQWLRLIGKGSKPGKVALPPLARNALDRYLIHRRLPVTPARWNPQTPLIGSLEQDSAAGITGSRLWSIMKRFFAQAADVIQGDNLAMADKLRRASPHWTRHSHASHALACGAELTTVRDNLRHSSIAMTSVYLHGDEVKHARQIREAFSDQ